MPLDENLLYRLVGERIREERKRHKLSQAHLAERLQISRASVVNIELGRQRPPLYLLWRIAAILDVEAAQLLPNLSTYEHAQRNHTAHVVLDPKELADIEHAANNDPAAQQKLLDFVKSAKGQSTKYNESKTTG